MPIRAGWFQLRPRLEPQLSLDFVGSSMYALARLAALIVATSLFLPAQQIVWFTPVPAARHPVGFFGAVDYLSLFSPTAPWQRAASHIQVFKLYEDGVDVLSDHDLRNLIGGLQRRKIALALEAPVLSSTTCGTGIEGFGGSVLPIVQRIKALGGTLTYVAMQQPFQWGTLYKGAGSCQWTPEHVAANALLAITEAKAVFPNLLVGDIMAVPPFRDASPDWAAQYGVWFETWRKLAGAPLAFFHVDVDWTVPNWQAAVADIRPVATGHGIPFGIVYNGFLTDETDAVWMAAAENHFVDYEVRDGNAPPEQVSFQTWNPHPTHVLPETDPTAFTYLIDRYFRTRTQLTLMSKRNEFSGKLTAGRVPVAGANVQITARPTSGDGAIATYTISGRVPAAARTAIVGARINSECYNCDGPAELTVYSFQYSESGRVAPAKMWDFADGMNGWLYGPGPTRLDSGLPPYKQGLHVAAQPGRPLGFNSTPIGVTPEAPFTLQITAQVSPISIGSGYFTLIWFNGAGREPSREICLFQPPAQKLATATTRADGTFSIANKLDSDWYEVTAEYAGTNTFWPAVAKTSEITGHHRRARR